MDAKRQAYYNALKSRIPDLTEDEFERAYASHASTAVDPPTRSFIQNAKQDVKDIAKGTLGTAMAVSRGTMLGGGSLPFQRGPLAGTTPDQMAEAIPGALVENVKAYRHPIQQAKEHPVSTLMDVAGIVIPGLAGVKAARMAAAGGVKAAATAGAKAAAKSAAGVPAPSHARVPAGVTTGQRIGQLIDEAAPFKVRKSRPAPASLPTPAKSLMRRLLDAGKMDPKMAVEDRIRDVASVVRGRPRAAVALTRTVTKRAAELLPEKATVPNPRIEAEGPFARTEIPLREAAIHYAEQGPGSRWAHVLSDEQRAAIDELVDIQNEVGNAARQTKLISGDVGMHRKILYGEKSRHFSHRWSTAPSTPQDFELTPAARGGGGSGVKKSSRQRLQRTIATYEDGMRAGAIPERLDPLWNTELDVQEMLTAASGRKAINELRNLDYSPGRKILYAGRATGHPEDYVRLDLPQNPKYPSEAWVHPDFADAVKGIVEHTEPAAYERSIEKVVQKVKTVRLGASLFHWHALWEESVFGGQLPRVNKGLEALWAGDERIVRGMRNGLHLEAGGSTPMEASRGMFKNVPGIGKAEALNDRLLWDEYHQGLKSYGYLSVYEQLEKMNPGASADDIARQASRMANDQFGGLDWDRMLLEPRTQRMLRFAFLAPDWTASRVRIAMGAMPKGVQRAAYRGSQKLPIGKSLGRAFFEPTTSTLKGGQRPYRAYWGRAAAYGALGVNALNYMFSKMADGEGKYLWQNDKGHKDEIRMPFNGPDGQHVYARVGKVITEPWHWATDPGHTLAGKANPLIGAGYTIATGREFLTGRETVNKDEPSGLKRAAQRVAGGAETLIPIAAGAGVGAAGRLSKQEGIVTALGFPTSRGYSSGQYVEEAVRAILAKDKKALDEAVKRAKENNIPVGRVRTVIQQRVRRNLRDQQKRSAFEQITEPLQP